MTHDTTKYKHTLKDIEIYLSFASAKRGNSPYKVMLKISNKGKAPRTKQYITSFDLESNALDFFAVTMRNIQTFKDPLVKLYIRLNQKQAMTKALAKNPRRNSPQLERVNNAIAIYRSLIKGSTQKWVTKGRQA